MTCPKCGYEAPPEFTDNEKQIIKCVIKGMTNHMIALAMGISIQAVGNNLHRVYKKVKIDSNALGKLARNELTKIFYIDGDSLKVIEPKGEN